MFMEKRSKIASGTAMGIGVVMLVITLLLGFLAWQCITTDMYKLYSAPYQGAHSRVEYYEQQAQIKQTDALAARAQGQETIAVSYERIASSWQKNAQDARSYMQQHQTGAAALGIGALLSLLVAARMLLISRKKPAAVPPAEAPAEEVPEAPQAEAPQE